MPTLQNQLKIQRAKIRDEQIYNAHIRDNAIFIEGKHGLEQVYLGKKIHKTQECRAATFKDAISLDYANSKNIPKCNCFNRLNLGDMTDEQVREHRREIVRKHYGDEDNRKRHNEKTRIKYHETLADPIKGPIYKEKKLESGRKADKQAPRIEKARIWELQNLEKIQEYQLKSNEKHKQKRKEHEKLQKIDPVRLNAQSINQKSDIRKETIKMYRAKPEVFSKALFDKYSKEPTFDFTQSEMDAFVENECFYCGEPIDEDMEIYHHGIDRIDSNLPHTRANCVTSCAYCNYMKSTYTLQEFVQLCVNIAVVNNTISLIIDENYNFHASDLKYLIGKNACSYYDVKKRAKHCGTEFNLTEKQFEDIQLSPCIYCGKLSMPGQMSQIDKTIPSEGYVINNVVPACHHCNFMKLHTSHTIMIWTCSLIAIRWHAWLNSSTPVLQYRPKNIDITNELRTIFENKPKSLHSKYPETNVTDDKHEVEIQDIPKLLEMRRDIVFQGKKDDYVHLFSKCKLNVGMKAISFELIESKNQQPCPLCFSPNFKVYWKSGNREVHSIKHCRDDLKEYSLIEFRQEALAIKKRHPHLEPTSSCKECLNNSASTHIEAASEARLTKRILFKQFGQALPIQLIFEYMKWIPIQSCVLENENTNLKPTTPAKKQILTTKSQNNNSNLLLYQGTYHSTSSCNVLTSKNVDNDDITQITTEDLTCYKRCKICFAANSDLPEINYSFITKRGHVLSACAGTNAELRDVRNLKNWKLCRKCGKNKICNKSSEDEDDQHKNYQVKKRQKKDQDLSNSQASPKKQKIEHPNNS